MPATLKLTVPAGQADENPSALVLMTAPVPVVDGWAPQVSPEFVHDEVTRRICVPEPLVAQVADQYEYSDRFAERIFCPTNLAASNFRYDRAFVEPASYVPDFSSLDDDCESG